MHYMFERKPETASFSANAVGFVDFAYYMDRSIKARYFCLVCKASWEVSLASDDEKHDILQNHLYWSHDVVEELEYDSYRERMEISSINPYVVSLIRYTLIKRPKISKDSINSKWFK